MNNVSKCFELKNDPNQKKIESFVLWLAAKIDLFGYLYDIMIIDLSIECYLEHDYGKNVSNSVNICAKCV